MVGLTIKEIEREKIIEAEGCKKFVVEVAHACRRDAEEIEAKARELSKTTAMSYNEAVFEVSSDMLSR